MDAIQSVLKFHFDNLTERLRHVFSTHSSAKHLLNISTSYAQWFAAAKCLDDIEEAQEWQQCASDVHYDHELVKERLEALRQARLAGDKNALVFLLRTSLNRNFAGIGNPHLYKCRTGTKVLITEYISEFVEALSCLLYTDKKLVEFYEDARNTFGRTALLLSGGGSLALHHVGVIKCLWEQKLLPRIISGTSGGSIVAAFACTRTEDEYADLFHPCFGNLKFFGNDSWDQMFSMILNGHLYSSDTFTATCKELFSDMTFLEAYNRTRKILNITVSCNTLFDMPNLLNFMTAPDVLIWSAILVSCCVPFVFKPVQLMAKINGKTITWISPGHSWIDGSVQSDLPMKTLAEQLNVNHFIVSQVNPHVVPLVAKGLVKSKTRIVIERIVNWACSEFVLKCDQFATLGIFPQTLQQLKNVLTQQYVGDITILPDYSYSDFMSIFRNPCESSFVAATLTSERNTWRMLSYINNMLRIELELDKLLLSARKKVLDAERVVSEGHYRVRTRRARSEISSSFENLDIKLSLKSSHSVPSSPQGFNE